MHTRTLGQGLRVSAIGLGAMGMSMAMAPNPGDRDDMLVVPALRRPGSRRDVHRHRGGAPLTSTRTRVEASAPLREEVVGHQVRLAHRRREDVRHRFRPEQIRRVADASLRRLGIDAIDLFYQHRVDPNVPIEDVAGAVGELISAGKVRHFRLSEAGAATIRRAHAVQPVTRGAERVLLLDPRPRAKFSRRARNSASGCSVQPVGQGLFTGTVSPSTEFADGDVGTPFRDSRPGNIDANAALLDRSAHWPPNGTRRPVRSHWPGCWPNNLDRCRSRNPPSGPDRRERRRHRRGVIRRRGGGAGRPGRTRRCARRPLKPAGMAMVGLNEN